jgi:hypothetical protein
MEKGIVLRKADLLKLETRPDAEYPQEDKYPSGEVICFGEVVGGVEPGKSVLMIKLDSFGGFATSVVKEIEEEAPNFVQFKTINSRYKLIWKD